LKYKRGEQKKEKRKFIHQYAPVVVEHAREHASGVAKLFPFPRQPPKSMEMQLDVAVGE